MEPLPYRSPGREVGGFNGVPVRQTVPRPAAGREWRLTLPGGAYWRVLLGQCIFSTSAVVAARVSGFQITDGNVPIWTNCATLQQAANLNVEVSYALAPSVSLPNFSGLPQSLEVPDVILPPGFTIGSFTHAMDPGDQYSAVELYLQEIDNGHADMVRGPHHRALHVDLEIERHDRTH